MPKISLRAPLPILLGEGEQNVRNRSHPFSTFSVSLKKQIDRSSSLETADSHFAADSFFFSPILTPVDFLN